MFLHLAFVEGHDLELAVEVAGDVDEDVGLEGIAGVGEVGLGGSIVHEDAAHAREAEGFGAGPADGVDGVVVAVCIAPEREENFGRVGLADGAGDAVVELGLRDEMELGDGQAQPEDFTEAVGLGDGVDLAVTAFVGGFATGVLAVGDEEPVNGPAFFAAAKEGSARAEGFIVRVGSDDENGAGLGVNDGTPSISAEPRGRRFPWRVRVRSIRPTTATSWSTA